ncbi:MAG: CPBP family intramembrane metalloprotease [Treponema sp.]|nr:CPBP family intramembrane metalloprotease [Treponema sp.]MBR4387549.1 CPBP family intramembrane metalloprotease [Treponema sp.]
MKKKYLLLEFAIVFIFLLLPPIFVSKAEIPPSLSKGAFSFAFLPQLFIAILLNFQWRKKAALTKKKSFEKHISILKWGTITFGFLMLIFALILALQMIFEKTSSADDFSSNLSSALVFEPRFLFFLSIVLNFLAGAFFEEVLYREFFPKTLYALLDGISSDKMKVAVRIFVEASAVLIFAAAHRYMGIFAVANAALCAIALRNCYVKTEAAYTGAVVHFFYNMINLFFLLRPAMG